VRQVVLLGGVFCEDYVKPPSLADFGECQPLATEGDGDVHSIFVAGGCILSLLVAASSVSMKSVIYKSEIDKERDSVCVIRGVSASLIKIKNEDIKCDLE